MGKINAKTGAKRETVLDWAMRHGYDVVAVNRAWRRGQLAPTHHAPDGKLVVEPQKGLKLFTLKPGSGTTANAAAPAAHHESEASLTARLDPRGHAHNLRVAEARREHTARAGAGVRAHGRKPAGAEPVSLGDRLRGKRSNGR